MFEIQLWTFTIDSLGSNLKRSRLNIHSPTSNVRLTQEVLEKSKIFTSFHLKSTLTFLSFIKVPVTLISSLRC
jgi:hypothetical protein